jgi:hypothetical protein
MRGSSESAMSDGNASDQQLTLSLNRSEDEMRMPSNVRDEDAVLPLFEMHEI